MSFTAVVFDLVTYAQTDFRDGCRVPHPQIFGGWGSSRGNTTNRPVMSFTAFASKRHQ
jgi:hypothetical protein